MVNEVVADIIHEDAQRSPTCERLPRDPLPPGRDRPQSHVRGINHVKCPSKKLREEAQWATKRFERLKKEWWTKDQEHKWYDKKWYQDEHQRLWEEMEAKWDAAEMESWNAGYPYKDRKGRAGENLVGYMPPSMHLVRCTSLVRPTGGPVQSLGMGTWTRDRQGGTGIGGKGSGQDAS